MYQALEPDVLIDTCGWLDDSGRLARLFPARAQGPDGPLWSGAACFRENGHIPGPEVSWISWGGPLWERPRPRVGYAWLLQMALPRPLPVAGEELAVWTPEDPTLRRELPPAGHVAAILDDNGDDQRSDRIHPQADYRAVSGQVTVARHEPSSGGDFTVVNAEIDLTFEAVDGSGATIRLQATATLVE